MAAAAAKTVEAALWNFSWDQFRENHRVPNALFNDYLRFLALKAAASDFNASVLSPPTAIEHIWHVHLHDTRHYRAMCDTIVPGHFIHHDPKDRDGGNEDPVQRSHRRQQAVRRYEATWGNPPGIGKSRSICLILLGPVPETRRLQLQSKPKPLLNTRWQT